MTKRDSIICLILLALTSGYTALVYPGLPDVVPVHWNYKNEIDGWGSKTWGATLGLIFLVVCIVMAFAIPALSPKGFKVENFRSAYSWCMVCLTGLMGYLQVVILLSITGDIKDVGKALSAGILIFFALLGNVMGKVKRNFYIGIRTPWTLADERVWDQTHRTGAKVFVATGVIGLLLLLVGVPALPVILVLMLGSAFGLVAYSYFVARRLETV